MVTHLLVQPFIVKSAGQVLRKLKMIVHIYIYTYSREVRTTVQSARSHGDIHEWIDCLQRIRAREAHFQVLLLGCNVLHYDIKVFQEMHGFEC